MTFQHLNRSRSGAETGDLYVSLEAVKTRLNVLIGVVIAGHGIVIAGLFQIALRLQTS